MQDGEGGGPGHGKSRRKSKKGSRKASRKAKGNGPAFSGGAAAFTKASALLSKGAFGVSLQVREHALKFANMPWMQAVSTQ